MTKIIRRKDVCGLINQCAYISNAKISDPNELGPMLNNLCLNEYTNCPVYRDYMSKDSYPTNLQQFKTTDEKEEKH